MKKLLFFMALMLGGYAFIQAQELVVGGGMEAADEGDWTVFWSTDLAEPNDVTFGYTDDGPAAGQGGCLSVEYGGTIRIQIYQAVTLVVGHSYQLTGAFKNVSANAATGNWLELILTKTEPNVNGDWGAKNGDYFYQFHSWKGTPYQDIDSIDGTFQGRMPLQWIGPPDSIGILSSPLVDTVPKGRNDTLVFTIADTVTDLQWYVVMKVGCWHTTAPGNAVDAFHILFDTISLWDLAEPLPNTVKGLKVNNTLCRVYPNPSSGWMSIESSSAGLTRYKIINMVGIKVREGQFTQKTAIDVSDLQRGVYFVNSESNGVKACAKLIIK